MPRYEYKCNICNTQFEVFRNYLDYVEQFLECPQCHNEAMRIFKTPPVIYNTGGFYATDNRKGKGDKK